MKLRQIEAFRAVMETGSVSKGAGAMSVSQPAITRLIGELEADLGFPLFERCPGKPVRPTADADALYAEVEKVFLGLKHLVSAGHEIRAMNRGHLRVVAPTFVLNTLVCAASAALVRDVPGVALSLEALPQKEMLELIAAGKQDVGVVVLPADDPGVVVSPLGRYRMACVLPQRHPLASRDVVALAGLHREALVTVSYQSHLHQLIERRLESCAAQPLRRFFTRTQEAACHLVSEGLGIALIAAPVPRHVLAFPGIVIRAIEPALEFELGVAVPADAHANRVAAMFVEKLREACRA